MISRTVLATAGILVATFAPFGLPAQESAPVTAETLKQATYLDTVWVEGDAFQVQVGDGLQIWMSLTTGDYFKGTLLIRNSSAAPITFDPASIDATVWKKSRTGELKKIAIYTYPADEYVNNVESDANFRKAMLSLAYGLRSASAHMSSTLQQGDHAVADSIQRVGDVAERQEAAGRADRIDDSVAVETDGLMRKQTIFPGRTYAGRVMFGHARGDSCEFDMKIGSTVFVFRFAPLK